MFWKKKKPSLPEVDNTPIIVQAEIVNNNAVAEPSSYITATNVRAVPPTVIATAPPHYNVNTASSSYPSHNNNTKNKKNALPIIRSSTTTATTPPNIDDEYYFGDHPVTTICPYCNEQITTILKNTIDGTTVIAVVIFLITFWPLFWLPFVVPCCQRIQHSCPKCNAILSQQKQPTCL